LFPFPLRPFSGLFGLVFRPFDIYREIFYLSGSLDGLHGIMAFHPMKDLLDRSNFKTMGSVDVSCNALYAMVNTTIRR